MLKQRLLVPALSFSLAYAAGSCFKCELQSAGISAAFPDDASYSSYITPFNPRYTYNPAAFTFPSTADQVAKVVQLTVKEGLRVAARSGGHSYISNSLGGENGQVVVDLRNMTNISVDPETHIATIETGNRLGPIAVGLNNAGRATPHGTCPDVGIGGHASYGGSGYVNRQWGLALDAIEYMDIVLANGTLVRASHDEYPDLFWAMRGAGGSYGITTAFHMKTYPVPPSVTYFTYFYTNLTAAEATTALSTYQSFILSGHAPDTFGMNFVVGSNHDEGRVFAFIVGALYDDPSKFNETIRPMLAGFPTEEELGPERNGTLKVTLDTGSYIHEMEVMGQFTGSKSLTDTAVAPYRSFVKSLMTPEKAPMSEAAMGALVGWFAGEGARASEQLQLNCILETYGGPGSYVNKVPKDATAFVHRDTLFTFECSLGDVNGTLKDTPEVGYDYVQGMIDSVVKNMPEDWDYGAYPNYIDDSLKDWQMRYYGSHYERLQEIKKKYDPEDTFNFPVGIELPAE